MKPLIKLIAFLLVPALLLVTNCKDEPIEPSTTEFDLLTSYMADNNLDLPDLLYEFELPGTALNVNLSDYSIPDYYIIDLREQAAFDAGHIKDAHLSTLATVLDKAKKANGKKILVVCYTGEKAARAVAALRLMKYEAYSLRWGMSAWNYDFSEMWRNNAEDYSSPNWVTSGAPKTPSTFVAPKLNTRQSNGGDILKARVLEMLLKEWNIDKSDVLDNPDNYYVLCRLPLTSWGSFGHIKGACRMDDDLDLAHLNKLDPDATIALYCFNGQNSAFTGFWLDVLGYDSRSMNFGANGIVHNALKNGMSSKSWRGAESGSELNFGYYDWEGNLIVAQ